MQCAASAGELEWCPHLEAPIKPSMRGKNTNILVASFRFLALLAIKGSRKKREVSSLRSSVQHSPPNLRLRRSLFCLSAKLAVRSMQTKEVRFRLIPVLASLEGHGVPWQARLCISSQATDRNKQALQTQKASGHNPIYGVPAIGGDARKKRPLVLRGWSTN